MPHGRRRDRLAVLLTAIALAAGGEGGARLVGDFGLTISPDTLLRLLRIAPLPLAETPRVLGIDDWARRRGRQSRLRPQRGARAGAIHPIGR